MQNAICPLQTEYRQENLLELYLEIDVSLKNQNSVPITSVIVISYAILFITRNVIGI